MSQSRAKTIAGVCLLVLCVAAACGVSRSYFGVEDWLPVRALDTELHALALAEGAQMQVRLFEQTDTGFLTADGVQSVRFSDPSVLVADRVDGLNTAALELTGLEAGSTDVSVFMDGGKAQFNLNVVAMERAQVVPMSIAFAPELWSGQYGVLPNSQVRLGTEYVGPDGLILRGYGLSEWTAQSEDTVVLDERLDLVADVVDVTSGESATLVDTGLEGGQVGLIPVAEPVRAELYVEGIGAVEEGQVVELPVRGESRVMVALYDAEGRFMRGDGGDPLVARGTFNDVDLAGQLRGPGEFRDDDIDRYLEGDSRMVLLVTPFVPGTGQLEVEWGRFNFKMDFVVP
mgnify:CR=1 FL=1